MTNNLQSFCQKINYSFNKPELLEEALTHPSLSKEQKEKPNYQRLEFLGDKVLSLVIADFLMAKYPQEKEGDLSKRQAALVSGETLSQIALEIEINTVMLLSKGEKNLGGLSNKRNLENTLEAIIGAIYTDGNYDSAKTFILKFWQILLNQDLKPPKDPISELQEIIQSKTKELPDYKITKTGGSDHAPQFIANLVINNCAEEFSANGSSKKEAQRKVAKMALDYINKTITN